MRFINASQCICLIVCRANSTGALWLLPCQPTPRKARSLLPWPKPTVWPSSSGWRAVIDALQGCCSLPEATEAALVSFDADKSCLDGQ
jgi:hypothetical protein